MACKSFSVIIRAIVKKCLKTNALGRWAYPFFQKCWRSVVIPYRRRRLQKHGFDCVKRLHRLLSSSGILYHYDYGTLLGIVRDDGFIPHDDDVDVTIPVVESKKPQEILGILLRSGYRYLHGFQYEGRRCEFTVIDQSGITIDFFFPSASEREEYVYGYEPIWRSSTDYPSEKANTMIRYSYVKPTMFILHKFRGVDVSIPANYENILVSEYGQNWRIPDGHFYAPDDIPCLQLDGFAYRLTEKEFMS